MSNTNNKEKRLLPLVKASLFTGILCLCSWISILTPFGVPITLQTFAIALCGYVLGLKWGLACTATYILLGAVGLPVFSGFGGGIGVILGVTGGFILGFLPLCFLCGISKGIKKPMFKTIISLCGILLCNLVGFLQLSLISDTPFLATLIPLFPILLVKDIVSIILSDVTARYINRYI